LRRIPFVFLTNSGGQIEADRAASLSASFQSHIAPQQVVLSHSPMVELAQGYKNKCVVFAGLGDLNGIAKSYGFTHFLTLDDLAAAHPTAHPDSAGSLPAIDIDLEDNTNIRVKQGLWSMPIAALMVLNDPKDWSRDLQWCVDILSSPAATGLSIASERGPLIESGANFTPIYFSNSDLLWKADWHRPRFGQAAFRLSLERLYEAYNGYKLEESHRITQFGKPFMSAYQFAQRQLHLQAATLNLHQSASGREFERIYMIGDNPAADILGANKAGAPWTSVLVRTGVFQSSDANCSDHPAQMVEADLASAIHSIAEQEGWPRPTTF